MKKLTVLLAFFAFLGSANAQTIDTLVKSPTSVRINPIKAAFNDTANSVFLGAYAISDNLKNSATFYWQLMLPKLDSAGVIIGAGPITATGNYTMTSEQYATWCHENPCDTYPFTCIAQAYGLTFPTETKRK